MKFSVLMSTYYKESPFFLAEAFESLQNQSLPADEVVIVKDGKLTPELEQVIDIYTSLLPIRTIALEKNVGLGKALQTGVISCSFDYIARMDSDDIARSDRFEKQIGFLADNADIDIVGSWISEFDKIPENIYSIRRLPLEHEQIVKFAKKRCPLNHMTVIFKKAAVLNAGNYCGIRFSQDYHLWVRMLLSGAKFANIPECLVNMRAGHGMVARRGGIEYAKNEYCLQKEFSKLGFLSSSEFIANIITRIPVRLMPDLMRKAVYSFLRKH